MKRYLIVVFALLAAGPAMAQTSKQGKAALPRPPICDPLNLIPGCTPANDPQHGSSGNPLAKMFQDIADLIGSDSDAAIALSTAIPDLQDGNGQQCWMGMKVFGEVVKAHPVPLTLKAQTDLEGMRLLIMAANKLCSNTACTQVFADLTNGINTVAPVSLPVALPSLNSLCSKVPQIAVVAPVPVPPPVPAKQ